jgi:hypothetical protein
LTVDAVRTAALLAGARRMGPPEAALTLAAGGLAVFPCVPAAKRPLTRHGLLDATADLDKVAEWWGRWPDANLGLPTGARSGVEVVDVDVRGEASGISAFTAAAADGSADGWVARVATPSGGLHLYYPADPARPQRSWVGAGHVDFRGDGGYVLVPPSVVVTADGRSRGYQVTALGGGVPAPVDADGLRARLAGLAGATRPAGVRAPGAGAGPGAAGRGVSVDRIAAWVARRPAGTRNASVYWAARTMAGAGLDHGTALEALTAAAERAGLPARETAATVASAYRRHNGTIAGVGSPTGRTGHGPRAAWQAAGTPSGHADLAGRPDWGGTASGGGRGAAGAVLGPARAEGPAGPAGATRPWRAASGRPAGLGAGL